MNFNTAAKLIIRSLHLGFIMSLFLFRFTPGTLFPVALLEKLFQDDRDLLTYQTSFEQQILCDLPRQIEETIAQNSSSEHNQKISDPAQQSDSFCTFTLAHMENIPEKVGSLCLSLSPSIEDQMDEILNNPDVEEYLQLLDQAKERGFPLDYLTSLSKQDLYDLLDAEQHIDMISRGEELGFTREFLTSHEKDDLKDVYEVEEYLKLLDELNDASKDHPLDE